MIERKMDFILIFGLSFHQFWLYICHLASRIVST